jgi:hypothetical protein
MLNGGKKMKKIAAIGALAVLALVVPAQAKVHYAPPQSCAPRSVGYGATGSLVSSSLTSVGNGRSSGTIEVEVSKANHGGSTGDQTFTLEGARVKFHHGVDAQSPAPGSRVKLHGKITKLAKHCSSEGFTPEVTVKKVDIRPAKHS